MSYDDKVLLPPFQLNGTIFPRDIGGMILRFVIDFPEDRTRNLYFPFQEFVFIACRVVCKTWHGLLNKELFTQFDRNVNLIFNVLFDKTSHFFKYYKMLPYLISLRYPICSNAISSSVSILVAAIDDPEMLKIVLLYDELADLSSIWYAAIESDSIETVKYLMPAVLFNHELMKKSLRIALVVCGTIEMLQFIYTSFPKVQFIPAVMDYESNTRYKTKDAWPQKFDWIVKTFDLKMIQQWCKELILFGNFKLVKHFIIQTEMCAIETCDYLSQDNRNYNGKQKSELHSAIMHLCGCEESHCNNNNKKAKH